LKASVGVNFACFAARNAVSRKSALPFEAVAATTRPCSSMTTCTVMLPEIPIRKAVSGYCGLGKKVALLFTTPMFRGVRSTTFGGGVPVSSAFGFAGSFGPNV